MKILLSTYNFYNKQLNTKETRKNIINNLNTASFINNTGNDTVSFGSKTPAIFINDLRDLPDLPCGCCGKKMLRNSVVNNFLNTKITYPAIIALKKLKAQQYFNESKSSEPMREAYTFLKFHAQKNPTLTVNELLSKNSVKETRRLLSPEASEACEEIRAMTKLVSHNSKYLTDEINKLKPDFHKTEKRVFKELSTLSKKYPDLNYNEILNLPNVYEKYLSNLQKKQNDILKQIEYIANGLDTQNRKLIKSLVKKAKVIFTEEIPEIHHKRGRVISEFNDTLQNMRDVPVIRKILNLIESLPDSKTDVDAFMIKGSQKNSNLIAEILLNRQRNTFEHVKPHHREGDNGESNIYNYIGLCGKCNSERQRTGYDVFVQKHPEMVENEQIQINKIIDYINNGILTGYDDYPVKIQAALDTESKGAIKIDHKKLNILQAKSNRKKREEMYIQSKKKQNSKKEVKIFKFGKGYFTRIK